MKMELYHLVVDNIYSLFNQSALTYPITHTTLSGNTVSPSSLSRYRNTTSKPEAMVQSDASFKWLNLYGDFISKNASAVSQIESGLRSLTYIIPGRYRESDIASEAGKQASAASARQSTHAT